MSEEKPITFREDQKTIRLIDDLAKSQGLSRSDVIRRSIRRELDRVLQELKQE